MSGYLKLWHRTKGGYPATNIKQPDGRYKPVRLHKIVYEHYYGPVSPGLEIDHRDRKRATIFPPTCGPLLMPKIAANKGITRKNSPGL